MSLAIDTWRRFKRVEILVHLYWNYSDAQLEAAAREIPWFLAELAVLFGATIAFALWAEACWQSAAAPPKISGLD
jgi:hypothetical protein